jgi:hypothetical protein
MSVSSRLYLCHPVLSIVLLESNYKLTRLVDFWYGEREDLLLRVTDRSVLSTFSLP